MSFRITYAQSGISSLSSTTFASGALRDNVTISSPGRVEVREDDGTIIRLGDNTDFTLLDSPLGVRPEYGRGEVYIIAKGGCGKYRTSCYTAGANPVSERPNIFIRPGTSDNVDEFFAVSGEIVVYEFDESMRTFTICTVREGEKALITFDSEASKMIDKYSTKIETATDDDWDYILNQYMDRRKWS